MLLAITDDVLVGFGGAQYVVGNSSQPITAQVHTEALLSGSLVYIYAIFTVNGVIVIIFAAEALRTQVWRKPMEFNYLDSRTLVVGASKGGPEIADAALHMTRSANEDIGDMLVRLHTQDEVVAIQYAGKATDTSPAIKMKTNTRLASDDAIPVPR